MSDDQNRNVYEEAHGIEWPDHAFPPPPDPNESGSGMLAGMGGTLDIGVPLRDEGGRELRSVEIAPGVLWPDYGMVELTCQHVAPGKHVHRCIIDRKHLTYERCICDCGAVEIDGKWDEP